jgi:tRNA pseudouridine38-40 synthase
MQEAANYLVGEHDFKSFCTPKEDVENTVRTIYYIKVFREENMVRIRINGNGFLYNMVRIIVGSLLKVGMGMIPPEEIRHILEAKDRTKAGHKAAACGLTLIEVEYL